MSKASPCSLTNKIKGSVISEGHPRPSSAAPPILKSLYRNYPNQPAVNELICTQNMRFTESKGHHRERTLKLDHTMVREGWRTHKQHESQVAQLQKAWEWSCTLLLFFWFAWRLPFVIVICRSHWGRCWTLWLRKSNQDLHKDSNNAQTQCWKCNTLPRG